MKVAFDSNFKAMRSGEFVEHSINTDAGEFVLDSDSNYGLSTLKEIAEKNNVETAGLKKKEDFVEAILAHVSEIGLPTMDNPPLDKVVTDLVRAGTEADKSDDDLLIEIVQAGAKFSQAQKLLKFAKEELGLITSAKDRREIVDELLGKNFNPKSADEVLAVIPKITAKMDDLTDAQAKAQIRAYLKRRDLVMPQMPPSKRERKADIYERFARWLEANNDCTDKQVQEFFYENCKADSAKVRIRQTKSFVNMMRRLTGNAETESNDEDESNDD